jgi:hypothetical protein
VLALEEAKARRCCTTIKSFPQQGKHRDEWSINLEIFWEHYGTLMTQSFTADTHLPPTPITVARRRPIFTALPMASALLMAKSLGLALI